MSEIDNFYTANTVGYRAPSTQSAPSGFRSAADALLESAIAVASVCVGHARNDAERDEAFAWLAQLHGQREVHT